MPHLIVFSHLRWAFVYQRPQHLLSRLARHYQVLFVEEPMHLEPADGPPRIDRVTKSSGVTVLVPRTSVAATGFHDDQLSALKPLLEDYLRSHAVDDYLLWFYTPMALPLASELRPRAVVYDCMDELSAFKNAPRQLRQRETALLKTADLVFTGGPSLFEAKRHLHESVHCLPSSVDAAHYANLDAGSDAAHEAVRLQGDVPGPRLGFFGVIDERLDIDLVDALARAHPEWQIVMVGPIVKIDPDRLPRHPNLHWLGMQPYAVLPHLMAGWDVCLMPFALNESTRFISPTKTLEYFAGGKPVVSTAVPDVVSLHAAVARIAADHAEFIALCESALADDSASAARLRVAMDTTVRGSSWDRAAERMKDLIEAALEAEAASLQRTLGASAVQESMLQESIESRPGQHVKYTVIGAECTALGGAHHAGQADSLDTPLSRSR